MDLTNTDLCQFQTHAGHALMSDVELTKIAYTCLIIHLLIFLFIDTVVAQLVKTLRGFKLNWIYQPDTRAMSSGVLIHLILLTLNVRGPSYLGLTRSISWLLMPWLLTSPGHQQLWYWLCIIDRFLSYLRKDFNYLRRINVKKWHKM